MYVAFLLHFHQPCYRDAVSGVHTLPWVRVHALKDYYDVVQRMEQFPGFRCNINLVPSLVVQLDQLQERPEQDRFLAAASRPAADLTEEDRTFLLQNFFALNWERMLRPYARYSELLEKRALASRGEGRWEVSRLTDQDYRDLQVWFFLAWSGDALRNEPAVARLLARGRGFDEADKRDLLEVQGEFLGRILPLYQKLCAQGSIEISCSPLNHPILPLLCDARSARAAIPDLPLPRAPLRAPEDAQQQVVRARQFMQARLGLECEGMWPSEGAISPQAVQQMRRAGVRWIASDEAVLQRSLGDGRTDTHLRPWLFDDEESGVAIFFRDRELSDLVGFSYSRWRGADAAADLTGRLLKMARQHGPEAIASIILDGENAWEYYPDNGREFWLSLLQSISDHADLQPVTYREYLKEHAGVAPVLPRLHSGSWINGDLRTWMGHPDKNRAWDLLAQARSEAATHTTPSSHPSVWDCIYAAEGSDWFWWYGDDHATSHRADFDALFRSQLEKAYLEMQLPVPDAIRQPVASRPAQEWMESPTNRISPVIDGRITDYFEWLGAGRIGPAAGTGAMHPGRSVLKQVLFGLDARCLFFRLDPVKLEPENVEPWAVALAFEKPNAARLEIEVVGGRSAACLVCGAERKPLYSVAAGRVIEIAVPLQDLKLSEGSELEWFVQICIQKRPVERWPRAEAILWKLGREEQQCQWVV